MKQIFRIGDIVKNKETKEIYMVSTNEQREGDIWFCIRNSLDGLDLLTKVENFELLQKREDVKEYWNIFKKNKYEYVR